jgi:hypothetical protein
MRTELKEALMTEPRDVQRELRGEAADPDSEAIQDLDVTGDDADRVSGGGKYLTYTMNEGTISGY